MIYQPNHGHPALSDVHGKIEQVLISIRPNSTTDAVKRDYGGIFEALGGRVQFIVLGTIKEEASREGQLKRYRSILKTSNAFPDEQTFILEPDYEESFRTTDPSHWVQDPFSILQGAEGWPIFLEPYYFGKGDRGQDQHIAEQVSAYTGYLMKSTRYFFEGGNVLVGDDYMVVGRDTLIKNLKHYYSDVTPNTASYLNAVREITEAFKQTFGVRYVIWLGHQTPRPLDGLDHQGEYYSQPFFHLDLYLTLGGRTAEGKELAFVAQILDTDLELLSSTQRGMWIERQKMLNETAALLAASHGDQPGPSFQVERVRMGLTRYGRGGVAPLSMNNCLVEVYHGIKTVYLPRYRSSDDDEAVYLDHLSEESAQVLRKEGFSVIWVEGNFKDMAPSCGSLHCIVKVIQRKYCVW